MLRIGLALFSLCALATLSGCFTQMLSDQQDFEADPERELDISYGQVIKGRTSIMSHEGENWRRVQVEGFLRGRDRIFELLMPPPGSSKALIARESKQKIAGQELSIVVLPNVPAYASFFTHPPAYSYTHGKLIQPIDAQALSTQLLGRPLDASGTLAFALFSTTYPDQFGVQVFVLEEGEKSWKIAEERRGVVEIKDLELDWECRSRATWVGYSFGYLGSIPLDIVTFPFQLPFLIFGVGWQ